MLLQGSTRLLFVAGAVFVVLIFGFFLRPTRVTTWPTANAPAAVSEDYNQHDYSSDTKYQLEPVQSHELPPTPQPVVAISPSAQASTLAPQATHETQEGVGSTQWDASAYVEVSSRMTKDKKWFPIDFGDYGSYNPNLIPHPWKNDTWVMIAQGSQAAGDVQGAVYSLELVCEATYTDGRMQCLKSPTSLPIASTVSDHCIGDLEWFNYFIGPNDPRVFFGPDRPYITYGSASQYTCLGQWIHDLRRLVKWNSLEALDRTQRFFWPTELQRPPPYGGVEKNWFAFWDNAGEMYLHYDIYPSRSFARLNHDGSEISDDLAPLIANKDSTCLQKFMPELHEKEHIHQATNSLAITMCKKSDASCDAMENTYIFTIFHHKQYHGHNLYEPYIMMFDQSPPFGIYAISSKPFWINGRGKPGDVTADRPADQSQMMYITSMSWKDQNMTYHGYMDDDLMISFGVEDRAAGGIDVLAGDLIREMHLCA